MLRNRITVGNFTVCILILVILALPMISGAFSEPQQEPLYQRRNFFGMHNLKDGGPSIASGMEATKHLVGNGFVFDWVFDFEPWVEQAFKRNLIPCIRVQEGRGGALPDPGYAGNVAWAILNYKIAHPEYADRLVYLQLWNEPHDQRDKVEPDVYADYLVAAHNAVHQAENQAAAAHPELGLEGTFKTMTPGQNGPSWWDEAFSHNPDAKFAFDVWGTHPYPEATPPHYNLHDGDVFIETSKTIDSYLMDLDVVAMPHGNPPRSRRGFPVMITETAYGKKLGISYEGWPKTSRQMAADYNVDAFGSRWYRWPEIIAVQPYILSNWSWRDFEWIDSPSWEDQDGDGIQETFSPHPQYTAVRQLRMDYEAQGMAPARLTPYRGPKGTIKGIIQRSDSGEPVPYATIFTDGYEFGNVSLYDGGYEIHNVPVGAYTLAVEKNGYVSAGKQIDVYDGQTTTADFNLIYSGKVSKGIYFVDTFAGHSGCTGCDLSADFLGQTFTVPADVGFIKYAACKPHIDNVTMKFTILEGGPYGTQVGSSISATLESGDGAIMIGAEWPDGQEPAVQPGATYFLKVERADGKSIYCFASDSNPYADGNAYVSGTSHTGWDLYAVIRGLTLAQNVATGSIEGMVTDILSDPISGVMIATTPGGYTTTSNDSGRYWMDNLPAGAYSVSASKAGYATETATDVIINDGQTTHVDFLLEEAQSGSISGMVINSAGNPISEAMVQITPGDYMTTTVINGTFAISDVAPDIYTLQVTKAGYLQGIKSGVRVNAGETTMVDVVLTPVPVQPPVIDNPDFEADGGFFGVAGGWTAFGGNKWESVWDPERIFTQGVADIAPQDVGGVYQNIAVTPGARYRITVYAKTTHPDYQVVVAVDPAGGVDPNAAISGTSSTSATWTELTIEFTATGSEATLFLIAQNSGAWLLFGAWAQFDAVTIELLGTSDNSPPTAVVSASPFEGDAPLAVQFDGSGSGDPDGDTLSYTWDFGDGSDLQTGATASHIFTGAGTYNVTLTVNDGNGGADTAVVTIEVWEPSNTAPTAVISASPTEGVAPLTVRFDGSGSSDPDGDTLSYAWDFGDGSAHQTEATASHSFSNAGQYNVTLSVNDGRGGSDSDSVTISVDENNTSSNLISNGNFSDGLNGWSVWVERGTLNQMVNDAGQLQVQSNNHNGGLYQAFQTGGAGTEITISGWWASDPIVASYQWAEVLVINSDRQPVNGWDINADQNDVVLIYKNDTWATPAGWSGQMSQTAAVNSTGSFVAAGGAATIILKSGNLGKANSGMLSDDIVVGGPSGNRLPAAVAGATPTEGEPPLTVEFYGSDSSDPDGDVLTYRWDFGDGSPLGFEETATHIYSNAGFFVAKLTVNDGKGGSDTTNIDIKVSDPVDVPPIYGITIHLPPIVSPGERWWKLVKLHHLTCEENAGKHNLFTAFYYADGLRVEQGWQNKVGWAKNAHISGELPLEKNETIGQDWIHGNLDLYWNDNASLEYLNLDGSLFQIQRISGVHTRHPDECPGNTLGHHSFVAVYEERIGPND
jgi:PKD repeat protein